MGKVRYVIIGFGGIAENRITKEGFGLDKTRFNGLANAELIGAMDIDSKRKPVVESYGLRWYPSLEEVANDPEVDAVFIATNNLTHADLAEKILLANKHCIIDKPIATNLAHAKRIIDIAEDKKLSLSVDHMMTENAYNIKAKQLVQEGILGKVNDICTHMEFLYGASPEEAATWRCANPEEIGGPIGDVASHCLYITEFLIGSQVKSLACLYMPKTIDINVENGAFIQFKLGNDIYGTVRVAFNQTRGGLESTLTNLGYEIYGTNGILYGYGTLFQLSGHKAEIIKVRLELDDFDKVTTIRLDNLSNIYQSIIMKHASSILEKKPINAQDGLHNLNLLIKSHQSAKENGVWLEVE